MTAINANTASLPDLRRWLISRLDAFRAQVRKHLGDVIGELCGFCRRGLL